MESKTCNLIPNYPVNDIAHRIKYEFEKNGDKCLFVVRAPGRVNLIGMSIIFKEIYLVLRYYLTKF